MHLTASHNTLPINFKVFINSPIKNYTIYDITCQEYRLFSQTTYNNKINKNLVIDIRF